MSDAELHELIMMAADQMDSAFEFWITVSFGVLIAVHVAKDSIGKPLRLLICGLYLATSMVAILLNIGDVLQIEGYAELMSIPFEGHFVSVTADTVRFVVYLVGTVAVATAIFKYSKWTTSNDT